MYVLFVSNTEVCGGPIGPPAVITNGPPTSLCCPGPSALSSPVYARVTMDIISGYLLIITNVLCLQMVQMICNVIV